MKETRNPLPETEEYPQRVDYEYEPARRHYSCSANRRQVGEKYRYILEVLRETEHRKVAELLEGRYADCEKITLVPDNLNTHRLGAFYETFSPQRAERLVRRIEFCYTPQYGNRLNMSECELSCLTLQCLQGRRTYGGGDLEELRKEVTVWFMSVNASQHGVSWHTTVADACCKSSTSTR